MRFLLSIVFLLALAGPGWGATYYMRADGSAANKAAASGPCGTAANCMNVAVHNGETFSAGDTLVVCEAGGVYRSQLTVPSAGSSGNRITYTNSGSPKFSGADVLGTSGWTASALSEETGTLFASGLEHESSAFTTDFTGKTDASTILTVQSSVFNNGAYAGQAAWNGSASVAYAYKTITDKTDVYLRAYVKFSSDFAMQAAWNGLNVLTILHGTTFLATVKIVNDATAGNQNIKWRAIIQDNTAIYDGSYGEVALNTWYCLEIRFLAGTGANGGGQFWLNGTSKGSNFTKDFSTLHADTLRVGGGTGESNNAPANGTEIFFDDVKAEETGPIGTVSIGSYTNTYQKALTTDPGKYVLEDGSMLTKRTSIALVDANAGSYYWTSNIIYVNANGASKDPTSNGKVYETPIRSTAINLGGNDYISLTGLIMEMVAGSGILVNVNHADYSTITVCTFRYSNLFGIWMWEDDDPGKTDSVTVSLSSFSYMGYGVWMSGDNWTISGNTFSNLEVGVQMVDKTAQKCAGFLITGNTFQNITSDASQGYGVLIEADTTGTNADFHSGTVTKNIFTNITGRALDGWYGNSTISYNLFYAIRIGGGDAGIALECNGPNNKIYNNTIYDADNFGIFMNSDPIAPDVQSEVKNNITFCASCNHIISCSTGVTPTLRNNLYWKAIGGETMYQWAGTDYTFTNWKTQSGETSASLEANPLFTTPGSVFTLQTGSPAINTGVDVGLTTDILGNPIVGIPDMGAYENQTAKKKVIIIMGR